MIIPTKTKNSLWGWIMSSAETFGGTQGLDGIELEDRYYSEVFYEDAGNGLIRIIRYVKKKGVLVPVVSTLSSAQSLVQFGQDVSRFAREVLRASKSIH
jgi:hypothetical protein